MLHAPNGNGNGNGELLAYVTWKATDKFHLSHDEFSDTALPSLPSVPPAGARHIDEWTDRLGQPLETFIRREILLVPDDQIMQHLAGLSERCGGEVIDGVVAAIGIAYNFVLRARNGRNGRLGSPSPGAPGDRERTLRGCRREKTNLTHDATGQC